MLNKQAYSARLLIEKISIRERALILITLVALVLLLSQGILMLSGLDKHDAVLSRIEQKKKEGELYRSTLTGLEAAINNPKIIALQNSNESLQSSINILEERISKINEKLMSPDRMISLLKELLDEQNKLSLISFQVLPVTVIESNIDGGNLFYQHGLSMELNGEFEALTTYLQEIEALPTQLFWDELEIKTGKFPMLRIKINVHTLSQDEEWLNV